MEVAVILGCRLTDKCAGQEIVGRSSVAVDFLIKHKEILVIASGGKTEPRCEESEARVIEDVLLKHGLDPARIILEDKSKSTLGNAFFTQGILNKVETSISKLYLVTSCYHSKRADMIFSKFSDSLILSGICYPYTRLDETESMKYIRDKEILQRMGDLNNRERIMRNFGEWL